MDDISTVEEKELQEALVDVRKRKRKKKAIGMAIVAGILVIMIGFIWFAGYRSAKVKAQAEIEQLKSELQHLIDSPVVLEPVTPQIVQSVLSTKTNEISELATAEYLFTNAARFTDTAHIAKIFDWMTKKSFVQKWDGKIKAGVKLDSLQVSINEKTITITMPAAEILSYEINYDSVEVLDEKNNVFNPISVDDKVNFDKETKDTMITRATENGLLEKAQENAKSTIANLLTASIENIQDYKIEFVIATDEQ